MKLKLTRGGAFAVAALIAVWMAAGCSKQAPAGDSAAESVAPEFHCPMHPTYTSQRMGDCPICGMRLVPIKDGGVSTPLRGDAVPGRVAIMVPAEKRQLIGLATGVAERRALTETIRAVGVVAHDERRYFRVAPRFAGWVQSLSVNFIGQQVEKGGPLFTVYSPELFTAQNEYLAAWQNSRQLTNTVQVASTPAKSLLDSARRRLLLLQVSEEEVRKLEQTGEPSAELQVRSPASGHVVAKNAVEGQAFQAGETLYEIADLDHLWVLAYLFEYELGLIKPGQPATVTFQNLGNKTFETKVAFISPHIDPQTRRGEVRLEIQNEGQTVRPDMWGNVEFKIELGEVLAIPSSAVIDTGTRVIAFVDGKDQHLEPREVRLGSRTDEYVQVIKGVESGERVVSRALFLIDSESQLKAAIAGMAQPGASGTSAPAHGSH